MSKLNKYRQKKVSLTLFFIFVTLLVFNRYSRATIDEYIIGPGDVLDIVVLKDDNLTREVTVDKDGNITLPYIKEVAVSGLTSQQAAELIANKLKEGNFLIEPQMTVSVKERLSQKVMVFGVVKRPGVYHLKGKTFVLDLISQIGNVEQLGSKITILRKNVSGEEESIEVDLFALVVKGDLSQNVQILPGDHIVISRISKAQQIYILGEVKNPGPYTVEQDLSVLEALRMAGGFTDFANQGKAKVIREEDGKKRNIIVNLNKVRKGDKSADIKLQAGDVLVALRSWF